MRVVPLTRLRPRPLRIRQDSRQNRCTAYFIQATRRQPIAPSPFNIRTSRSHTLKHQKKSPNLLVGAFLDLIGRRPTLPHTRACSTIGAEGLNFRVRDGNGWDPFARITQKLFELFEYLTGSTHKLQTIALTLCSQKIL